MNDAAAARVAALVAARVEADPAFLAWPLARFRAAEGLDPAALAGWLGIAPDRLARLALCLRPRAEAFPADIDDLAARFGADPTRLADLLRRVDALSALAETAAEGEGLLAAARERDVAAGRAVGPGLGPSVPDPTQDRDGRGRP